MDTNSFTESNNDSKQDLIRRLKKIEGQVKGLQRMVESDKYCVDILIQVAAVRAAINKVGTMVFENHSRHCILSAIDSKDKDAAIEELIGVLGKFVR